MSGFLKIWRILVDIHDLETILTLEHPNATGTLLEFNQFCYLLLAAVLHYLAPFLIGAFLQLRQVNVVPESPKQGARK